jgi:hypothetical protein
MYSKSATLPLLLFLLISGCSSKSYLAPNLCLKESSPFSSEEIETVHLKYFSENMQLVEAGHYLSGVYVSKDGERVYTSVYEGNRLDSILNSEAWENYERKRFGDTMFWFNTANQLYLFSSKTLVLIDFPPSREKMILPNQDSSEFFKLCE